MGRPFALVQGLDISVSQIKSWLRCPHQYVLHYVRGVEPAFVPVPFAFGSAFHEAAAAVYLEAKVTGSILPLAHACDVFRDAWERAASGPVPLQADPGDEEVSAPLVDKGVAMVAVLHAHAASTLEDQVVEAVEQPFAVSIYDPDTGEPLEEQLVGTVDAVVRAGQRRFILEHKTSARRFGIDQLRHDLQPTAYRLAARLGGLGDASVRYQIVTKTKVPALQVEDGARGASDEEDLLRTSLGVLRSIDAGVDYPVRGAQCRSCPYGHACSEER